jgi:hypothetical protein
MPIEALQSEETNSTSALVSVAFRLVYALACLGLAASVAVLMGADKPTSRAGWLLAAWLPLSALLWFGGIIGLLVISHRSRLLNQSLWQYVFVLSSLALGCVLLVVRLDGPFNPLRCHACALADLAVVGIFLCSVILPTPSWSTLPRRFAADAQGSLRHPLALIPIIALVLSASGIAFGLLRTGTDQRTMSPSQFGDWYLSQPRISSAPFETSGVITVLEFLDYQCHPCKYANNEYQPLFDAFAKEHPGSLEVRVLDFPLDSKCNPRIRGSAHPFACEAAAAVRLARAHGRGDAMAAWLFANQETLSANSLRKAAKDVGGVDDFDGEYPRAIAEVKRDIDLGLAHGVNGTPTLFVNGVKLGYLPAKQLTTVLALELPKIPSPGL